MPYTYPVKICPCGRTFEVVPEDELYSDLCASCALSEIKKEGR